jgi:2-amino-4-hydroxy-6-hydroxymethyldihydropteridine diphosphokinase
LKTTAYIGLGSNVGERLSNCRQAIRLMGQMPQCSITNVSSFYRTEPQGLRDQEWFINAVCSVDVSCYPRELLSRLLAIEQDMGRVRMERWGPRLIDLDILLFGDLVMEEDGLVIPHPLMHLRRFVMVPLAEIASDLLHPSLKKGMAELRDLLSEQGQTVLKMEV